MRPSVCVFVADSVFGWIQIQTWGASTILLNSFMVSFTVMKHFQAIQFFCFDLTFLTSGSL